jgi:hypothetical protein
MSGNEFADASGRDSARTLVRILRVFEKRDPERFSEVL